MMNVVCALITEGDNVLVAQRSAVKDNGLKWEFPGGKIEKGENAREAIIREIAEELNIDIVPEDELEPVIHDYGDFVIRLIPFWVKSWSGAIRANEHNAVKWVKKDELKRVDFSEADKKIVERL